MPRCPAPARAPLPSARARPATQRPRVPHCPAAVCALLPPPARALLPSARARPATQRPPRSAARALAHPAAQSQRAPRSSAPARTPLPSARARPAALRPRMPHYPRAVHTLLPCAPRARPAARVPRTPCCPARLAYAAAATKLLLPLAKSMFCPAQRYHAALPCCPALSACPCCAPLAHAASRAPLPCRAARDLPSRAAQPRCPQAARAACATAARCCAAALLPPEVLPCLAATQQCCRCLHYCSPLVHCCRLSCCST
ncbi:unnamed protein product [Closterium sp. Naga37s-1]|nr:unnamed protein product [Closterium sp. Naga37s-1]